MKKFFAFVLLSGIFLASYGQNITAGLAAHYTFEGTPADVSGNGNGSTPAGPVQYVTPGVVGGGLRVLGDSSLFYSGGGHILLPSFTAALNNGFTVSLWAKDESPGIGSVSEEMYVSFGILDQPMCSISLSGSNREIAYFLSAGSGSVTKIITKALNYPADLGAWKHLVLVYTPGKFSAYYNGAKVGEAFITTNIFPAARAALGRHWWAGGSGSSARMSATFDNVRIYGRALSDADVSQLYVTDQLPPQPLPTIASQPASQIVIEQQSTTFRVTAASETPTTFQWLKNGVSIAGATSSTYTISNVTNSDAGTYSVLISNAAGNATSAGAVLTVRSDNPGRLINLSTLGTGGFAMGFVIGGTTAKTVLVRAAGPSLSAFGVANAAAQTALTLYSASNVIASNSRWSAAPNASQIANVGGPFPFLAGSADSAILLSLNPGSYTAQSTANGAVLLEVYEVQ